MNSRVSRHAGLAGDGEAYLDTRGTRSTNGDTVLTETLHSSPPCSRPAAGAALPAAPSAARLLRSPCWASKRSQSKYCMYSSSSGSAVAHSAAPSAVSAGSSASAPSAGASKPASLLFVLEERAGRQQLDTRG